MLGRVNYWTKDSKSVLFHVFGVDVEKDDPHVNPGKYCHRCRNTMYHASKEGGYSHHRERFSTGHHTRRETARFAPT